MNWAEAPNTTCSRPRFARGQRLGLAQVWVVQASLRREVRAAHEAVILITDVANVQQRAGVMLRGRWIIEAQLQAVLTAPVESFKPSWVERLWPLSLFRIAICMMMRKVRKSSGEL